MKIDMPLNQRNKTNRNLKRKKFKYTKLGHYMKMTLSQKKKKKKKYRFFLKNREDVTNKYEEQMTSYK